MKILFVFYNTGSGLSTHGGIALLSAIAKQEGYETKLLHFHEKLNINFPEWLENYKADIVAFTATDFEYQKVNEIALALKALWYPNALFLLGGKSAVEIATKDITDTPFDAFCIGEAEIPWLNLLATFPNARPDGFWFKEEDNCLLKRPIGQNIENLDELPFPDYSIFDMDKIIESKGGWLNVQFSRGCIFNCTYCYVTADKHFQGGNYSLRNNSVSYAMDYLESLCKQYPGIKVFNLDDELPISIEMHKGNKYNWWLDFCSQYKQRIYDKYNVEFVANGRINLMTENIIEAMIDAGCRECRMGFESGSFRIRKDILDKPITDEKMREVYALCDKHGLRTTSFTMIGNPTETEEDIWKTIRMTAELKPYLIRMTFCYPFEGTRLWFEAKKNDWIKEDRLYKQHGYFEESVFNLPIDEQKLMAYRFLFPWYVNTQMLTDPNLIQMYNEFIWIWQNTDFTHKDKRQKIIEIDKELSEACGNKEHFCYFGNGYFHCKNKVMSQ